MLFVGQLSPVLATADVTPFSDAARCHAEQQEGTTRTRATAVVLAGTRGQTGFGGTLISCWPAACGIPSNGDAPHAVDGSVRGRVPRWVDRNPTDKGRGRSPTRFQRPAPRPAPNSSCLMMHDPAQ